MDHFLDTYIERTDSLMATSLMYVYVHTGEGIHIKPCLPPILPTYLDLSGQSIHLCGGGIDNDGCYMIQRFCRRDDYRRQHARHALCV